jgi:hypothetical protein
VTGQQHHLGRDAAVGAGGVGLAGYEHRKHEGQHSTSSGLTGSNNQYDPNNQYGNTSSPTQGQSALRKAEVAGERKYDSMAGQQGQSGYAHPGQQSGIAGNQYGSSIQGALRQAEVAGERKYDQMTSERGYSGQQYGLTGGSDGRNRLHKDPPANHPAAQGDIPASGSERSNLI